MPTPVGNGLPSDHSTASEPDTAHEAAARASIVQAIRARPLLTALVTLAALLAGLALVAARSPTYRATAQLLFTPLESGTPQSGLPILRDSGDPTRLVQTAATVIDSDAAVAATAAKMGSAWTPAKVDEAVSVEPQGQSNVIAVTATAHDAQTAARVANVFATAALDARRAALRPLVAALVAETETALKGQTDPGSALSLELARRLADLRSLQASGDPTLSLARPAVPPTGPTGPLPAVLLTLALLAGLAVGVASALVAQYFGAPRLIDAAEAVAISGAPVLARVPAPARAWRWGRRSAAAASPRGGRAYRALPLQYRTLQIEFELAGELRRRVLFTGASPGDGTTACVMELGLTLANAGHEVLLVDLDPSRQLSARLGAAATPPLTRVLGAGQHWTSAVVDVPRAGLRLLSVGAFSGPHGRDRAPGELKRIFAEARGEAHFVLVDAPPVVEDPEPLRALTAVDSVVLVVRPGRTRLADLETAVDLLERTRRRFEPFPGPDGLIVVRSGAGDRRRRRVAADEPAEAVPRPAAERRAPAPGQALRGSS